MKQYDVNYEKETGTEKVEKIRSCNKHEDKRAAIIKPLITD